MDLKKILADHALWLQNSDRGNQAFFTGKDLRGVAFHGLNLCHADFTHADLRGADFHGAFLEEAVFRGGSLQGADFQRARLDGADFRGASLEGTQLQCTKLQRCLGDGNVVKTFQLDRPVVLTSTQIYVGNECALLTDLFDETFPLCKGKHWDQARAIVRALTTL